MQCVQSTVKIVDCASAQTNVSVPLVGQVLIVPSQCVRIHAINVNYVWLQIHAIAFLDITEKDALMQNVHKSV